MVLQYFITKCLKGFVKLNYLNYKHFFFPFGKDKTMRIECIISPTLINYNHG